MEGDAASSTQSALDSSHMEPRWQRPLPSRGRGATRLIVAGLALCCRGPAEVVGALVVRGRGSDAGAAAAVATASGSSSSSTASSGEPLRHLRHFETMEQCSAEVDRLSAAGCGDSGLAPRPFRPWQSRRGLVHDENGNPIIKAGVLTRPYPSQMLYKPPISYSGIPSDSQGWDYRHHGDDWVGMGECGGPSQSPVDLSRFVGGKGQTKYLLWFDYYLDPDLKNTTEAALINDGHGLRYQVRPNGVDFGYVKVGDREFAASEYIFHAPSEHSIDGALFPLELQVYNEDANGGIIAVAVFFREGASNDFIAGLMGSMNGTGPVWSMKGRGVGRVHGTFPGAFNLEQLIPKSGPERERTFYNYNGSLTHPPCTTGIDWWVLSSPLTASREEIRFVKKAIFSSQSTKHGNARSSMPLGNRKVTVGLVGFQHAVKGHQLPSWRKLDEFKSPRGYGSGDAPWGPHWTPVSAGALPPQGQGQLSNSKPQTTAVSKEAGEGTRDGEDDDDDDAGATPVEDLPPT